MNVHVDYKLSRNVKTEFIEQKNPRMEQNNTTILVEVDAVQAMPTDFWRLINFFTFTMLTVPIMAIYAFILWVSSRATLKNTYFTRTHYDINTYCTCTF